MKTLKLQKGFLSFAYAFTRNKYRWIRSVALGCGYKSFGQSSIMYTPLRIIGKQNISIGEECFINGGLRMEAVSSWGKECFSPEIVIGDRVTIGQYCHFTCARHLIVGEGVSIFPEVLITDIEHQYVPGRALEETGLEVGSVRIGAYAVIGMGVRILGHRGIVIGENAVIGANTVVMKDVPPNTMVVGNPARPVRRYDFKEREWVRII